MAIDFDAITIALAARFAPAAVTPPTGYDNVKLSTGDLPDHMTPLPTVLVYPESSEYDTVPKIGGRDSVHDFVVRFYYNQTGDLERDTVALRKWLTVLVDQLRQSVQLGGIVTRAAVSSSTVGVFSYARNDFTGIELIVRVVVNEPWAAVA